MITNPHWPMPVPDAAEKTRQAIGVTSVLLVLLGASFMWRFREVIGLAVVIVAAYMALSAVVIGAGVAHLVEHPAAFHTFLDRVAAGEWCLRAPDRPLDGTGPFTVLAISLIIFPKLALGLSGFETGVAVMPQVRGKVGDDLGATKGRMADTRKQLVVAAVVMSVYLVGLSVVVASLVPPEHLVRVDAAGSKRDGVTDNDLKAKDRALAYLAHGENPDGKLLPFFGEWFGTAYDLATVVILGKVGDCCCRLNRST